MFSPSTGETPSEQQPYLVSAQVLTIAQPLSNGPLAGVFLSGQHPNVVFLQSFLALHFFSLGTLVTKASSVLGVVPSSSSVVDQMSTVELSKVESGAPLSVVSVLSEDPLPVVSVP